jgi:tRNA(adenine34) deaminase
VGIAPETFMQAAYALAISAQEVDEVPVGAVVVVDDEIIGRGYNQTITRQDPTAHAEIVALRDAAATLGNYRMPTADLYVTIEPCTMCAGALIHARIRTLYFATAEPRSGAVVSTSRVLDNTALNHRVTYEQGLCQDACAHLIKDFFAAKR